MNQIKYLDLAGLTFYDKKLKEWFKYYITEITEEAIRALFAIPVELPPNNEIWYTSSNGDVVIPTNIYGVTVIDNTYENGKGIITFDGDVTSLRDWTFSYYYSLTSITLPNSVTDIGRYAFNECKFLTSVTIPNSVTSIGYWAFKECSALPSITIPNSVTSIGSQAFWECSGLTTIIYDGTQAQWNAIAKGDAWNYHVPATYVQCTDGKILL
jgi:hypothetical protein